MSHALHVWHENTPIAVIEHEGLDDRWRLRYAAQWLADASAFPVSPTLPLVPPQADYASAAIKRFIEHLLPEGRALDVAVAHKGLTKTNIFGLIRALGAKTAGALRFYGDETVNPTETPTLRPITLSELDDRIARRDQLPLTVWDGQVRMSVAGLQDKGYEGKTIGIKLRYDNFQAVTRDQTLTEYTADAKHIRLMAGLCLKRVDLSRRLRLLGVRVGSLIQKAQKADSPTPHPQQDQLFG